MVYLESRSIIGMRILIIVTLLPLFAFGADTNRIKQLNALRITKAPKIDGVLDEAVWQNAQIANNFIQLEPDPGNPSAQKTEVKVLYDNTAIYIGAVLYDVSSDSILKELTNRDEEGNVAMFGAFIDTYNDDQNAFAFGVLATGVQLDIRYSLTDDQDFSWDAIWDSKVYMDDKNWYVEMKIPYSALRFPDTKKQVWGINFCRKIRRTREYSFWNEVNPEVDGFVNQFGQLNGIEDIESPLRLSVVPYVSGYIDNYKDGNTSINNYSLRGGLDLKYGINDAFTLDMTLIPDFGQVQSDNEILNLSPFEVRYDEKRPFFIEGTELFKKGDLFYSRRIGKKPSGYYNINSQLLEGEIIKENQEETQLINATKISGRTNGKLGIGVLNALTAPAYAILENTSGETRSIETEPMTNYNVLVLDQSMKNNSFISFINTNVMREGSTYDANVTGAEYKIVNKKNTISTDGNAAVSQKYFNNADSLATGYQYELSLEKISGNLQFGSWYLEQSDTYDPNDLGYLPHNNKREGGAYVSYNIYKPFWKMLNSYNSLNISYARLYNPDKFNDFKISLNSFATLKNYLSFGINARLNPVLTYDYYEPRVTNRFYTIPTNWNAGTFISSDYRKRLALDVGITYYKYSNPGRYGFSYFIGPRVRINDRMSCIYMFNSYDFFNDVGYATNSGDDIIFGRRDYLMYENTLTISYIFTNRMGLNFRLRHNWTRADYNNFYLLGKDGYLYNTSYMGLDSLGDPIHNVNFNAFNIDMVYTWVFAPGSELNLVWKQAILSSDTHITDNYFTNLENTLSMPQTNSFSFKILYYLDYLYLKKSS